MALLEREILASPELASPPRIDHDLLAEEIKHSRAWPRYMDATRTILTLSLNDEAIGEALVVPTQRGDASDCFRTRAAAIESLDVNPGRYHLGLLIALRHAIVLKEHLLTIGGEDYRMVSAAPDIAVHLHGWQHERTNIDGVVGFAFNRINPDIAIPARETIGRRPAP